MLVRTGTYVCVVNSIMRLLYYFYLFIVHFMDCISTIRFIWYSVRNNYIVVLIGYSNDYMVIITMRWTIDYYYAVEYLLYLYLWFVFIFLFYWLLMYYFYYWKLGHFNIIGIGLLSVYGYCTIIIYIFISFYIGHFYYCYYFDSIYYYCIVINFLVLFTVCTMDIYFHFVLGIIMMILNIALLLFSYSELLLLLPLYMSYCSVLLCSSWKEAVETREYELRSWEWRK